MNPEKLDTQPEEQGVPQFYKEYYEEIESKAKELGAQVTYNKYDMKVETDKITLFLDATIMYRFRANVTREEFYDFLHKLGLKETRILSEIEFPVPNEKMLVIKQPNREVGQWFP